jgi:hypothetical protein
MYVDIYGKPHSGNVAIGAKPWKRNNPQQQKKNNGAS